ncbi:phospholipase [Nocardioides anomalus]|uniref:phospholipase C n=1 Tax=Nocardioides anomalus TaxID=2712223 RepID=A0A6G6W9G1_9ACTN|nr:alkaline phosphatase family protein [Nocardioides anomalus]QIG41787.1 phospholipase [Nocardioides anomalus]
MTDTTTPPLDVRPSRRSVIMGAAAVAGAAGMSGLLPESLASAAVAPAAASFDLSEVKHVVYVMQENRSFDHYFGTFPGVRGFDDPTAMTLPNGNSVFQQPDPANPNGYLRPFHMDTASTAAAAVPSLSHDWRDQHASWNKGAMDGWLHTHLAADGAVKGSYTMGYMLQEDIPFHWALAEHFTLLDNYHCSVLGPTYPNRAVWMSGTHDPQGTKGGPILETVKPNTLQWLSAAEVLYNAGYTVKTYTSSGSYNYFSWWKNLTAKGMVDDQLYNRLMSNGTLFGNGTPGGAGDPLNPTKAATGYLGFEEDCRNGTLADVTWLFPDGPYASDEHPPNTPAAGAYFLASKLEALAANPELWNSTVFVINYDENDGFFDHVAPPIPDPDLYPEEYVKVPSPRGTPGGGLPAGAGFRVPCLVISPWTVGGHVYSQVSDHTSPLQLIEAVTAAGGLDLGTPTRGLSAKQPVTFEAITAWRRATFDDLVGVFHAEALAAPSDQEFGHDVREANYQAQLAASSQAMPTVPGAVQPVVHQDPVPGSAAPAGAAADAPQDEPYAPSSAVSRVRVTDSVPVGRRAVLTLRGGRSGSAVVVRSARGQVVARTHVPASGRAELRLPTDRMAPGRHGFTVMYVDADGQHHTTNLKVRVTPRHR